MSRIIAIDPGKVSGWAVAVDGELVIAGEYPHLEMQDYLSQLLHELPVAAIVSESYIISGQTLKKSRGGNWSLYQIGVFEWLAYRHGVPLVLQSPSEGKSFGTDAKLRKLGWYMPTKGGHRNDACRHLLTYLVRSKQFDLAQLL